MQLTIPGLLLYKANIKNLVVVTIHEKNMTAAIYITKKKRKKKKSKFPLFLGNSRLDFHVPLPSPSLRSGSISHEMSGAARRNQAYLFSMQLSELSFFNYINGTKNNISIVRNNQNTAT